MHYNRDGAHIVPAAP
ncbi:hypothetical protein ACT3XG_07760 [Paenibacillus polymyxa]|nr:MULTISPECIES: hypothetical protein [Paenibacillus]WHX38300.1 hypothetical protein QNH38_07765 [Paenibacillus polymyxa]